MRTRVGPLIAFAALALALWAPSSQAATQSYAPQAESRNFNGGDGGWTHQVTYQGLLCDLGLTCPNVTNSFVADGGLTGAGDGYIRSDFEKIITALAGTSVGTWESPEFTFAGVKGSKPVAVDVQLHRTTSLAALLELPNSDARYSVNVIDVDEESTVPVITDEQLPEEEDWTGIGPVAVDPAALRVGRTYKLQIRTAVTTPLLALFVDGWVGYDEVRLRAHGVPKAQLSRAVRTGIGAAALKRGKVRVPVRCPKQVRPGKCRAKVTALLKGKGPAVTKRRAVAVRGGKKKIVALKVKPRYAAKVATRKRLVVRAKVRAMGERFTVKKRVKVRR